MKSGERTYTLNSTAWPRDIWNPRDEEHKVDALNIRIQEGEIDAEFHIEWINLERGKPPAPLLRAFDDAWRAVLMIAPLLEKFGSKNSQPQTIIKALQAQGFAPSNYHGQLLRENWNRDRMEFERMRRDHPDWFAEVED